MIEESDGELEERSRPHPIDESHKVTLRYDTEKHINPRTGEIIEGVKHTEKNPLSYDVQNIEPVAPGNIVRRYGVKENVSQHSSAKDSAYGSLDVNSQSRSKTNRPQMKHNSVDKASDISPSRSLGGSSVQQNISSLSTDNKGIQKSVEVFAKEMESVKGSTSTLHSVGNSSRSNSLRVTRNSSQESAKTDIIETPIEKEVTNAIARPNNPVITQNGFSPGSKSAQDTKQPYISMKNTIYESVTHRTDYNQNKDDNSYINNVPDSPYTSMMNIVQGQIKISPLANESDKNIVDVSVTPINRSKKV